MEQILVDIDNDVDAIFAANDGLGNSAATAVENNMTLSSSNAKHFKAIKELQFKIFKP